MHLQHKVRQTVQAKSGQVMSNMTNVARGARSERQKSHAFLQQSNILINCSLLNIMESLNITVALIDLFTIATPQQPMNAKSFFLYWLLLVLHCITDIPHHSDHRTCLILFLSSFAGSAVNKPVCNTTFKAILSHFSQLITTKCLKDRNLYLPTQMLFKRSLSTVLMI